MNGESLLEMEADERARSGMFLAFNIQWNCPVLGDEFLRAR